MAKSVKPAISFVYKMLSVERLRKSHSTYDTVLDSALSDKARLVYSAPFRRLQDKAQVFSLESNAAVRSRLTHSIEVSMVGRLLAERIARSVTAKKFLPSDTDRDAFVAHVETACLMHDLGNPPFGHFCEASIAEWFVKNEIDIKRFLGLGANNKPDLNKFFDIRYEDFKKFDGNPQGFRIVTKLQFNHDKFGLNLTATQLAASLKYPWSPLDSERPEGKKIGVFASEHEQLTGIRKSLNLSQCQRHLLAYVMEAADDISYCMSDIEDAIEKDVITWSLFIKDFQHAAQVFLKSSNKVKGDEDLAKLVLKLPITFDESLGKKNLSTDKINKVTAARTWHSAMLHLRTGISRRLVDHCVEQFETNSQSILNGKVAEFDSLIAESAKLSGWPISAVKKFSKEKLYNCRLVRQRELTAYKVTTGLLDAFKPLLIDCDENMFTSALEGKLTSDYGDRFSVQPALVSFLPKKYVRAYRNETGEIMNNKKLKAEEKKVLEWMARSHLVVDYITGMTDKFALDTFQLISGVRTNVGY